MTLSPELRALPLRNAKPDSPEYLIFQVSQEESFCKEVEETNPEEAVFVTKMRLEQICLETSTDTSLRTLMSLIMSGWPDDKLKTPLFVREYWP